MDEHEELGVMALFHDIYDYSDFAHHGQRVADPFAPFLEHDIGKEVVGGHLGHAPDKAKLRAMKFDSPLDASSKSGCRWTGTSQ